MWDANDIKNHFEEYVVYKNRCKHQMNIYTHMFCKNLDGPQTHHK